MNLPQKESIIVIITSQGEIIGQVEEVKPDGITLHKPLRLAFQFIPSQDGKMVEFASMLIPILYEKTESPYLYLNTNAIIGWYVPDKLIQTEYLEKVSGLTIPRGSEVNNLLKS